MKAPAINVLAGRQPATARQLQFIRAICRDKHIAEAALDDLVQERFGMPVAGLDRKSASGLIEELQTR